VTRPYTMNVFLLAAVAAVAYCAGGAL